MSDHAGSVGRVSASVTRQVGGTACWVTQCADGEAGVEAGASAPLTQPTVLAVEVAHA